MGNRDWWIPPYPGRPPDLRTLLYGFRWPLLATLAVFNGLGAYWLWTVWKTRSYVAAGLGIAGLVALDMVAGVLALYVWWGRRR
jgi:hypothetical protein